MLGRELARSLASAGIAPRLVAERAGQQEWRIGVLTVVVAAQRAELRYAREPVGRAAPNADAITAAALRARERLEQRSTAPDDLIPQLVAAYRDLAAPRVPLVALRTALAPPSRAQFAWDLARLRREQRLVTPAGRIDLGIATGTAAQRRSRVVWIEDDGGGGAFYETFRLLPTEAP